MKARWAVLGLLAAVVLTACPNPQPPDFGLDVDPDSVRLHQGESLQVTLRVMPRNGFAGSLALSLEGAPSGVTLSPASVDVAGGGGTQTFTLTVSADSTAPLGSYAARLRATAGRLEHAVGFGVEVVPPAGSLDAGFGHAGVALLPDLLQVQGSDDAGHALAVDADGRILVLAEAAGASSQRLALLRLEADGSPDTGFGVVDLAPIAAEAGYDLDRAVAVTLAGKVLVAGYTSAGAHGDDAFLARLEGDGSFDPTFGGGDGWVGFDSLAGGNGNDRAYAFVQDADGGIVFAGYSAGSSADGDAEAYLARAPVDGSGLDTGFGTNGVAYGDDSDFDAVYSVARTPGGGYVAVGTSKEARYRLLVAKLNADGQPDPGFNGGDPLLLGGLVEDTDQDDRAYAVAVDAEGRILVTGYGMGGSAGSTFDLVVLRLNPDGSFDTSFGDGGKVVIDRVGGGSSSGSDVGYSIVVDGSGRILVAGVTYVQEHVNKDLFVLRLAPDGQRDTSFGDDGVVVWDGGHGDDGAYQVALDGQGRILVTGYTTAAAGDRDALTLRLVP